MGGLKSHREEHTPQITSTMTNTTAANNKPDKQTDNRPKRKRSTIFIFAFFIIAIIVFSRQEPVNTIDCTPAIIASKPDVIMLGAWWCTYCYQAKRYFQKNNISYCEYDVENTAEGKRLYQANGAGAVPILLVGEYQLNGFSEQQLEAALNTLKN